MTDDHGVLRDEDGKPIAYRVLVPGLPNIPLMESQIWPEDMSDSEATWRAREVEKSASRRIGANVNGCPGGHEAWWIPDTGCPWCKAVV